MLTILYSTEYFQGTQNTQIYKGDMAVYKMKRQTKLSYYMGTSTYVCSMKKRKKKLDAQPDLDLIYNQSSGRCPSYVCMENRIKLHSPYFFAS